VFWRIVYEIAAFASILGLLLALVVALSPVISKKKRSGHLQQRAATP
jgi:hypothetical protein